MKEPAAPRVNRSEAEKHRQELKAYPLELPHEEEKSKMRSRLLTAVLILLFVPSAVFATSPIGLWKTIDDESGEAKSIVEIYEQDSTLYGRVIELLNPPPDNPNPVCEKCEGDRKDEPIEGMVILHGMKPDGDAWSGGAILDPENGKTYRCKLWVENGKLKIRGYVTFFYRTQEWLPVER
ncbi:DUF2147 domain-containing protein [Nitrococcus mobilis]|uniref:DUF2147 domain-containing protein n=1 Tax=Nitrococcus mobilis TaxID=35797 RepID=UPI001E2C180C|nr:DUF2147 domain-containing protein [Nitrococcus mobilis]